MGKPLTIQIDDDRRLEALKEHLHAHTKVEVLRRALDFLEERIRKQARSQQLIRAAGLVADESARANKEFRRHSLLKKLS